MDKNRGLRALAVGFTLALLFEGGCGGGNGSTHGNGSSGGGSGSGGGGTGSGSGNGSSGAGSSSGGGNNSSGGGSSSGGSGGASSGGGSSGQGSSGGPPAGSLNTGTGSSTGQSVPGSTGLPALPLLTHVQATISGGSANITFDPYPGAVDYRVYVAPATSAIHLTSSGALDWIDNAAYRCAGRRAAPPVSVDGNAGPPNNGDPTTVPDWISTVTHTDKQSVWYYTRSLAEATLGYGFADPVDGTVPVYAVGDPNPWADNYGYGIREPQTRSKLYVTDNTKYLASGWRDDGIAFYAPDSTSSAACGSGNTPTQFVELDLQDGDSYGELSLPGNSHLYYAKSGAEATFRSKNPAPSGASTPGGSETGFFLCPTQTSNALPVMRVFYELESVQGQYGAGGGHDELVLGKERFDRARCQGSTFGACTSAQQSLWEVHWSGITGPTHLIVEALDAGCPFQGLLGPVHLAPTLVSPDDSGGNTTLMNDPITTFAEHQAASTHGEVFINGQWDGSPTPHPIARTAVDVSPQQRPAMDFASDFVGTSENFVETLDSSGQPDCGYTPALVAAAHATDPNCDGAHRVKSANYDVLFYEITEPRFEVGTMLGQLWDVYSGGKFRISPTSAKATMSDSSYLHAVMEVSSISTGRRYPQIMVSTQDFETSQWLLEASPDGNGIPLGGGEGTAPTPNSAIKPVLVLNPIDSDLGRPILEVELCNQRPWQVNDHCPWFLLEEQNPTSLPIGNWTAHPDTFDRFQDDRSARFDLFVSTQKVYVFLDSLPYGCVDLTHRTTKDVAGNVISPAPAPPPAGPVSVMFGDVNYHEGAENGYFQIYSSFHLNHELFESIRAYDYIAFSSNVSAPPWNESVLPCATQMHQGDDAGTQSPEQ